MSALETSAASEFDADTAVMPVAGGWRSTISDRWDISGYPNGGYLLATVGRTIAQAMGSMEPLTVTAHFLRPTEHGVADITAELIRDGRRFRTAVASLSQQGRERVRAIATFGRLRVEVEPTFSDAEPPDLPPPERLPELLQLRPPEGMPGPPELLSRFDLRLGPGVGWPLGGRAGSSEISGWIRFADGRPPDALSLLLFADAFPPPILDVTPSAWVPTLELTVHVRAQPVPGWLGARFRTRLVRDGLLEEDGEVWDADGQLVAMSRQLALLLPVG